MIKKTKISSYISLILLMGCSDSTTLSPFDSMLQGQLVSCEQEIDNELLANCRLSNTSDQLEIWTWNLRFFPQDPTTAASVLEIIEYYQPDIVALQEINNRAVMLDVIEAMPLYEGWVVDLSGNLDLAFLYNTCTISSENEPVIMLDDIWPRPPVSWHVTKHNFSFELINIHLKCCSDGVADRLDASEQLTAYIEAQGEQPTVLPGDFNDAIDGESLGPFYRDPESFRYADEHISFGSTDYFSYPGWPSDLDHILINRPLFSKLDTAATLLLDRCLPAYSRNISDHRAVAAIFNL